jgi:membrane protein DedA with SNARE-associated domain
VQALLVHFGHLAVFALLVAGGLGVPVPEELIQLTAGYLARRGVLAFWPAVGAAWLGIVTGDVLFFLLARRHGPRLLASRHVARWLTPARREALERHFARHAVLTIMVARHASGFRLPAYALAASNGVRPLTFALADGASALASVPLVLGAGWYFASRIEEVKRDLHEIELVVAALVLAGLIGWALFVRRRARRALQAPAPQAPSQSNQNPE